MLAGWTGRWLCACGARGLRWWYGPGSTAAPLAWDGSPQAHPVTFMAMLRRESDRLSRELLDRLSIDGLSIDGLQAVYGIEDMPLASLEPYQVRYLRALGGPVLAGVPLIVGESGRETFIPGMDLS
jgi:hypothetical protein